MRFWIFLLGLGAAWAQAPDPAYEPLNKAYAALKQRDYDEAIGLFRQAIDAAPMRAPIRKDLAYTYLKIGENLEARGQFREAMLLDPKDYHVALEYAFLCFETKEQAQARRVFDRVRKAGDPESRATAEQAFQNIDRPLAEGIERWTKAIQLGGANFSGHFELATLAEQRDELDLAAQHYELAWRLLPDRRSVLVDLGRVLQALNRTDAANAVLLAASRGGEPRAADAALEMLPRKYPYVSEFQRALDFDPHNLELRREMAYLMLRMGKSDEAEKEFVILTQASETDYLSAAQLGFIYLARGEREKAMPLLERVMRGGDEELVNRVRAVLHLPQTLQKRSEAQQPEPSIEAKVMAERSLKAGYIKDALKYLQIAQEADPADFAVMLKLGWTYNMLHNDEEAMRWFALARMSSDPSIAQEAKKAYRNLRPDFERVRISFWTYPLFSTRWHDLFSYAQAKVELRLKLPVHPYFSVRFIGDTRGTTGQAGAGILPQYLSESAIIPGFGLGTQVWHGLYGWAEAGLAIGYLTHHVLPDYRGGVSFSRGMGHLLKSESSGFFAETNNDAIYVSRFDHDFLVYSQTRLGYTPANKVVQTQFFWNFDVTTDVKREPWANYFESGPGLRFRLASMPSPLYFTASFMRGNYLVKGYPYGSTFTDVRAGLWYAFTY